MGAAEIRWAVHKLEQQLTASGSSAGPLLKRLAEDPALTMEMAIGCPDSWQKTLLRSTSARTLVLCGRQIGKSTAAGCLAENTALLRPGSLTLLLSPSLRQSVELFRKVRDIDAALGRPVPALVETITQCELANGSRIVSLPGSEATTRGYSSASLIVIDEAARVQDALYKSVRAPLATSGGKLVCLTTPFGRRGWFYSAWTSEAEAWDRIRIPSTECKRISAAFLAEEREALGARWYSQEYLTEFAAVAEGLFSPDDIAAMFVDDAPILDLDKLVGGRSNGK